MMQGGRTVRPGTGRQDGRGSGYGRTGRAKAAGNGRTTSPNEKGNAGSKAGPTRFRSGKAGRTRYRSSKTNPTRDRSSGGNSAVYPGWKPLSAAVVAGSDAGQLAEAAEIMRRKGFSPVIEMLYRAGSRLGGAGETEAASNRSEADVRHPDLDAIHVHEALAAGSVLAAASEKDAVLYADAGLGADALARLPAQALIAKAVSSRRPCAAVPSSTSRAVPFSSWSKSMVLSAFMHWSLGEETRSFASMERAVFALNRKAAELLQGDALADPAEALATLLAAGGKAVTVTAPAAAAGSARAGKPLPEEGVRCAQAVVRILERKGGPRSAFPDYDRRRDVAGKESD